MLLGKLPVPSEWNSVKKSTVTLWTTVLKPQAWHFVDFLELQGKKWSREGIRVATPDRLPFSNLSITR